MWESSAPLSPTPYLPLPLTPVRGPDKVDWLTSGSAAYMVFYNGGLDVGIVPWRVQRVTKLDDQKQALTETAATFPAGVVPLVSIEGVASDDVSLYACHASLSPVSLCVIPGLFG